MWTPRENDDYFGEPQEEDHDPPALPEVQWLVSDWNKTYLVRGHVDPAVMLAAVHAYGEESPETFSTPTHAWWRTFPKWQDGERVQLFQHAEPNARGAFKCTVMTKDW